MTSEMAAQENKLISTLKSVLGEKIKNVVEMHGEVTIEVGSNVYFEVMAELCTAPGLKFDQLIDICGLDYSAYRDVGLELGRFAVVAHLLSVAENQRLRVRVFCSDDDFPQVQSVSQIWNSANWYERETFDLFGINFVDHPDLRRILTDYGFVGNPFRKDFPLSGHVEMAYDEVKKRVIYQPVTIEPRENTPRVIREEGYGRL